MSINSSFLRTAAVNIGFLPVALSCSQIAWAQAPEALRDAIKPANVSAARDPILIYKQAGIDKDQEEKIQALANQYEKVSQQKYGEAVSAIRELRSLTLNPDLDSKKVIRTQNTINRIQGEMAMDKIRLLIDIRKLLNPEQRQRLVEIMHKQRPYRIIGKPGAAPSESHATGTSTAPGTSSPATPGGAVTPPVAPGPSPIPAEKSSQPATTSAPPGGSPHEPQTPSSTTSGASTQPAATDSSTQPSTPAAPDEPALRGVHPQPK